MWHLIYRLPLLLIQITVSLLSLVFCNPIGHRTSIGRYTLAQYTMLGWARLTCVLFGLRVRLLGELHSGPLLVVANHQSWQDVIVLLSIDPMSFVAKQEIRGWPFIGMLVAAAGTVFLQRGNLQSSSQVRDGMHQALSSNKTVLIFPEAGVPLTPGVGRFHGRLFAPAIDNQTPVQPIAIRYLERGELSQRSRFKPNESFIFSFFRLLTAPITQVQVHALEVMPTNNDSRRSELALKAEKQVRACYDPDNVLDHERARRERPV